MKVTGCDLEFAELMGFPNTTFSMFEKEKISSECEYETSEND